MTVNLLSPEFLPGIAEYSAFHVLSLDHEHAVAGHDDMVDLRGAVLCRQGYVFEQVINFFIEKTLGCRIDQELPEHAFHERRFQEGDEQQKRNHPPVSAEYLAERLYNDG